MWIMGVSYSHNGAACLLRDNEIFVAIQEERINGVKRARISHYQDSLAVAYCLDYARIELSDLELLVVCQFTGVHTNPTQKRPARHLPKRFETIPHHLGHAYAAFFTSGFNEATILVVDGQGGNVHGLPTGEQGCMLHGSVPGQREVNEVVSIYGAGESIILLEKHTGEAVPEMHRFVSGAMPRDLLQFGSLGGMYAAVSALIFGDATEAGKVMGLAPYGRPSFPVEAFFTIDASGRFHYSSTLLDQFREMEPWPANQAVYQDLSASVQQALQFALTYLGSRARTLGKSTRLCYAGGVALNSVANEALLGELDFEHVYIMPAAEDSGTAVGAAFWGYSLLASKRPPPTRLERDSVGRSYASDNTLLQATAGLRDVDCDNSGNYIEKTVSALCSGKIVGWFDAGSELGPRALGQRSILCDPRRPDAKEVLNERVKHREGFRPFAPAILRDEVHRWFDLGGRCDDSPYMLRVWKFRDSVRSLVPGVVHVDGTGRVQTVSSRSGRLYDLIAHFHSATGVPLLLNTSFNLAGEPIVETPSDALWCLIATGLDAVIIDGTYFQKGRAASLLDYFPRLVATEVRLQMVVAESRLVLDIGKHARITLAVETPYGAYMPRIKVPDVPVLRLCDGTRDGWEILAELRGQLDISKESLERTIYLLRRKHILQLQLEPR